MMGQRSPRWRVEAQIVLLVFRRSRLTDAKLIKSLQHLSAYFVAQFSIQLRKFILQRERKFHERIPDIDQGL